MDSFINLSGHHTFSANDIQQQEQPFNIPASRFLRPYHPLFKLLEPLRLKRINDSLDYAAKNKQIYHLWWHPHNFGTYTKKNLDSLEKILKHFVYLKEHYGMKSLNMGELR